ncbi:hypothetical protein [Sulfurimonas xiamenensis]|uniref:Uncharacterized protein n=1 Tax=Sulfurimonas xiamenensis TaxID=2590021 RepID=A0AAJ4DMY3_9BACT|nr:hypothetical protein [Sulfurimonas xiamenensis]QFR43614.1 hypothetical protein FJR47_06700 [Sulfurimonas xiamenensis]
MKYFLINVLIVTIAFANSIDVKMNIKIEQNIRALYKDLNLNQEQKEYIEESEEKNINTINKTIIKEAINNIFTTKNIRDKNIVQFDLEKNGTINNIKLILKSDNIKLNKTTKSTIKKVANKLLLPKEKITLRYIFRYDIINNNKNIVYKNAEKDYSWLYAKNEININKGTTHFKYNSKEYSRVFNTNRDGFIDVSQEPIGCAKRVTILTEKGQNFAEAKGLLFSRINKEAPKGKYKILIQTKQDCNINLQYQ